MPEQDLIRAPYPHLIGITPLRSGAPTLYLGAPAVNIRASQRLAGKRADWIFNLIESPSLADTIIVGLPHVGQGSSMPGMPG